MILIGPRLFPTRLHHRYARCHPPFLEGVSRGRPMVLPLRPGVDRDRRADQTDTLPPLQDRRHAHSTWRPPRIRRQQPATNNTSRAADLLQQPPSPTRLRTDLQHLARRQNPTPEPDHPRPVDLSPTRRRRHYRRRHPRHQLQSQRPNIPTHLETIRPPPKRHPYRPTRTRTTPSTVARIRTTARSCPSPRPSSDRLPPRRLSDRRLSTHHPLLLPVSHFSNSMPT